MPKLIALPDNLTPLLAAIAATLDVDPPMTVNEAAVWLLWEKVDKPHQWKPGSADSLKEFRQWVWARGFQPDSKRN